MFTYSIDEVVQQLTPGGSDWWLREGMRTGRFPFLAVRPRRFTDDHVKAIAAELERKPRPQQTNTPADVSVFGTTARSAKRHRNRAS